MQNVARLKRPGNTKKAPEAETTGEVDAALPDRHNQPEDLFCWDMLAVRDSARMVVGIPMIRPAFIKVSDIVWARRQVSVAERWHSFMYPRHRPWERK